MNDTQYNDHSQSLALYGGKSFSRRSFKLKFFFRFYCVVLCAAADFVAVTMATTKMMMTTKTKTLYLLFSCIGFLLSNCWIYWNGTTQLNVHRQWFKERRRRHKLCKLQTTRPNDSDNKRCKQCKSHNAWQKKKDKKKCTQLTDFCCWCSCCSVRVAFLLHAIHFHFLFAFAVVGEQ